MLAKIKLINLEKHTIIIGYSKLGRGLGNELIKVHNKVRIEELRKELQIIILPDFRTAILWKKVVAVTLNEKHYDFIFHTDTGEKFGLVKLEPSYFVWENIDYDIYIIGVIGDITQVDTSRKIKLDTANVIISTIGEGAIHRIDVKKETPPWGEVTQTLANLAGLADAKNKLFIARVYDTTGYVIYAFSDVISNLQLFNSYFIISNEAMSILSPLIDYFIERGRNCQIMFISNNPKVDIIFRETLRQIYKRYSHIFEGIDKAPILILPSKYYELTSMNFDDVFDKIVFSQGKYLTNFNYFCSKFINTKLSSLIMYNYISRFRPDIIIVGENSTSDMLGTLSDLLATLNNLKKENRIDNYNPIIVIFMPQRSASYYNLLSRHSTLLTSIFDNYDLINFYEEIHNDNINSITSYILGIYESYLFSQKSTSASYIGLRIRSNKQSFVNILARLANYQYGERFGNISVLPINSSILYSRSNRYHFKFNSELILSKTDEIFNTDNNYPLYAIITAKVGNIEIGRLLEKLKKENDSHATPDLVIYDDAALGDHLLTILPVNLKTKYMNLIINNIDLNKEFSILNKIVAYGLLLEYPGSLAKFFLDLSGVSITSENESSSEILNIKNINIRDDYWKLENDKAIILSDIEINGIYYKEFPDEVKSHINKLINSEFPYIKRNQSQEGIDYRDTLKRLPAFKFLLLKKLRNHNTRSIEELKRNLNHIQLASRIRLEKMNDREYCIGKFTWYSSDNYELIMLDPLINDINVNRNSNNILEVSLPTPGTCLFIKENDHSDLSLRYLPRILVSPSLLYFLLVRNNDGLLPEDIINKSDLIEAINWIKMSLSLISLSLKSRNIPFIYLYIPIISSIKFKIFDNMLSKLKLKNITWDSERRNLSENDINRIINLLDLNTNNGFTYIFVPLFTDLYSKNGKITFEFKLINIFKNTESMSLNDFYKELINWNIESKNNLIHTTFCIDVYEDSFNFMKILFEKILKARLDLVHKNIFWNHEANKKELKEWIFTLSLMDAITFLLSERIFKLLTFVPLDIKTIPINLYYEGSPENIYQHYM